MLVFAAHSFAGRQCGKRGARKSSRRFFVPACPGCTSVPECKIIERTRQYEDAPNGPNIPPSGRGYYRKVIDKRCLQTVFSRQSLQSPIKINVFTQVPCLIIAAKFLEYAFAAELTGSLSHASKKPDNTPKLQIDLYDQAVGLMNAIYCAPNAH